MTSSFTLPSRRALMALSVCLAAGSMAGAGVQAPRRADAERFLAKIDAINRHAEQSKPTPFSTVVTEQELNAYLAYDAVEQLPAGLTEPRVTVLADLSLSGTATIDLDAVKAQRQSRGWLDPLNYLGGAVPVAVVGRLEARNGLARFSLVSARVAGVGVPKIVVQELLAYYTKNEERPAGLSLDDPYPLPARIREITVRPGEALITQ